MNDIWKPDINNLFEDAFNNPENHVGTFIPMIIPAVTITITNDFLRRYDWEESDWEALEE